jgi:hypothetical protein
LQINNLAVFPAAIHEPPFCALAAYGWLAHAAAQADGSFRTSGRDLGRAFGWPEARVRRFLRSLAGDALIDAVSDAAGTTIRLRIQKPRTGKDKKSTQVPTQEPTHLGEASFGELTLHDQPNTGRRRTRGARLPTDWRPSAGDFDYALERGFSAAEVEDLIEEFRNYWTDRADAKARRVTWSGTWRNRVREEAKRRRPNSRDRPRTGSIAETVRSLGTDHRRENDLWG